MDKTTFALPLLLTLSLALLAGCGGGSDSAPGPLSPDNVNLVFVASEDLAYNAAGDVEARTANLTPQGLHRTLLMGTFLRDQVLGTRNVNGIYALVPMTHLQTADRHPDLAGLLTVQQFAMLNRFTMDNTGTPPGPNAEWGFPINASYLAGQIPVDAAQPFVGCAPCQGLYFDDAAGGNLALANSIVKAKASGYHVFAAPWSTISRLMGDINRQQRYHLDIPTNYAGPNAIYAISIAPAGVASLVAYDSRANPGTAYPVLPAPPLVSAGCPGKGSTTPYFSIAVSAGVDNAFKPEHINVNETVYFIRHAEAHPVTNWEYGNYVAAGQWRSLALANAIPNALRGAPTPTNVYSIDPAQVTPGVVQTTGTQLWSYVRPTLTVAPYAIAANLPFDLVTDFELLALDSPGRTADYFFNHGTFSNRTVVVAWEHDHIAPIVDMLLLSYFPNGGTKTAPPWPGDDYDTIWTVTLDGQGNATVDNGKCEGISSEPLPAWAPAF